MLLLGWFLLLLLPLLAGLLRLVGLYMCTNGGAGSKRGLLLLLTARL